MEHMYTLRKSWNSGLLNQTKHGIYSFTVPPRLICRDLNDLSVKRNPVRLPHWIFSDWTYEAPLWSVKRFHCVEVFPSNLKLYAWWLDFGDFLTGADLFCNKIFQNSELGVFCCQSSRINHWSRFATRKQFFRGRAAASMFILCRAKMLQVQLMFINFTPIWYTRSNYRLQPLLWLLLLLLLLPVTTGTQPYFVPAVTH